jgi:UDP-N-acetylmuramate--alanine ligase
LPVSLHKENYTTITYGFDPKASVFADNIKIVNHRYYFDYHFDNTAWSDLELGMPGKHNVENALAAITVARLSGLSESEIRSGLKSFRGVKRRFEYILNTSEHVFIDDYAHHPEELKALILSVKEMYPNKRVFGVFQPHLFTRTRDFADAFAESLSLLDTCRLLPIYPAREEPIDGVTSEMILTKIKQGDKAVSDKATLSSEIADVKPELLLTIGAGDIDNLIPELKEILC